MLCPVFNADQSNGNEDPMQYDLGIFCDDLEDDGCQNSISAGMIGAAL